MTGRGRTQATAETKLMQEIQRRKNEIDVESIKPQNPVNEEMRAMIARTLSSFRKE